LSNDIIIRLSQVCADTLAATPLVALEPTARSCPGVRPRVREHRVYASAILGPGMTAEWGRMHLTPGGREVLLPEPLGAVTTALCSVL
jgi:hypothetical protein